MTAYLKRMPAGFVGEVSRRANQRIETQIVGTGNLDYGIFVKISSGKLVKITSGDTAADIYGLTALNYPTMGQGATWGPDQIPAGGLAGVLRSGYITVKLNYGTAAAGGAVYVRVADHASNTDRVIGTIEAVADSTDSVAVPNCYFMGPADANGIVEISFNV